MTGNGDRRGPGRRAVLRWTWRLFRREWRQQLLTVCVLTVAVAGAVWFSTAAVNGGSKAKAMLGDAKALIRVDPTRDHDVASTLDAIRARFGDAEVVAHASASVPGVAGPIDVRAQDPNGRFSRPTLGLRSGRYPTNDAEVALTDGVATEFGAHVGDQVTIAGQPRTVVGLIENPSNLDDEFALVAPTTTLPNPILSVFVGVDPRDAKPVSDGVQGFDVITMGDDNGGVVTLVVAAVTVSMALVGLVAASSFVVIAKRRQRQLGMLGALGATQRQVRLALVAAGAVVGAVAAFVGLALGFVAWLLSASMIERASAHRIDRFDLPWALLAFCVAVAIAAAITAAWWPARTLAKVPVVAAISQRPTPPLPVHRSALSAVVVLAAGVVAIAIAKPRDAEVKPALLIIGLVAVIAGTVLVAPAAIRLLALPARRLPLPSRVALRDLARYQARAAAALAAITLALGVAVATTVVAKATDDDRGAGNLPTNQLLVSFGETKGPFATMAPSDVGTDDAAANRIASTIQGARVYPLDVALPRSTGPDPVEPISEADPVEHGFNDDGPAYVATPELLALYGIDPSSIDPATELLTSTSGAPVLLDASSRPDPGSVTTRVQHVALSRYAEAPHALVMPSAVERHGWKTMRAVWLINSPTPISADQLAAARRAAADAGLAVDAHDVNDATAALGRWATIVGTVLALVILAMTVGLIRGESAADVRTLTAVGAPSRTRRAITATSSGALAIGGVALASIGAYIAVGAVYRSDLTQLSSPPVTNLLIMWLGLPIAAAISGWVLAGRQPAHIARQLT
jgi:putative ABC transport system permease protein